VRSYTLRHRGGYGVWCVSVAMPTPETDINIYFSFEYAGTDYYGFCAFTFFTAKNKWTINVINRDSPCAIYVLLLSESDPLVFLL
jgi:hypothetical protein